jgi:hypothetical protein
MNRWGSLFLAVLLLSCRSHAAAAPGKTTEVLHAAPNPAPTVAYKWLDITLEATAREVDRTGARPTPLSRSLAIALTAMYDAWATYDAKAVGTRLGAAFRRPPAERTLSNQEVAIQFATFRALLDLYPADAAWLEAQFKAAGLDPKLTDTDPKTPAGVGNAVAAALVAYRHHDGANQLGDEAGSDGKPYSDFTYYRSTAVENPLVPDNAWHPIPFDDGKGGKVAPGFLTPHWYRVKPFALDNAAQFRPPAPPKVDSPEMRVEIEEVMHFNASLTLEQKAVVEFMRDGPRSTGQSGHWLRFAQDVSRRDKLDLEHDVKLFFAVSNVVFDAFISCWDAKRHYDLSRPYWWVRNLHPGEQVLGWGGPGKGVVKLNASEWRPYSPGTFLTPPFPGFPSGHSSASGAAARLIEHFTGSNRLGVVERRVAGAITEPGFPVAAMQSVEGKVPANLPKNANVELKLDTLSGAAELAGLSRIMGGYHVRSDNTAGLELGRKVADFSWPRYQAYFDGTATPAP